MHVSSICISFLIVCLNLNVMSFLHKLKSKLLQADNRKGMFFDKRSSSLDMSLNQNIIYFYTTCQAGSEKALKGEFKKYYPDFRPSFSRPGLITWKSPKELSSRTFSIKSTFTRAYGLSLGFANNLNDILTLMNESSLLKSLIDDGLTVHVFGRDEGGKKSEHPDAIQEKQNRIKLLETELLNDATFTKNYGNYQKEEKEAAAVLPKKNSLVLNIIVGEVDEPYFVGFHVHSTRLESDSSTRSIAIDHSPYPGGIINIDIPPNAPSRAFAKIEEAIAIACLPIKANQVALEIGSAPGGACYALLNRGLYVYGVDPSPHDRQHAPVVKNHENFVHIKGYLENLSLERLPRHVDWLLCDANISPFEALPHLAEIVSHYSSSLKGIVFTSKFGDQLWGKSEDVIHEIDKIKLFLVETMNFKDVESKQLPSNRQEVLIWGLK